MVVFFFIDKPNCFKNVLLWVEIKEIVCVYSANDIVKNGLMYS